MSIDEKSLALYKNESSAFRNKLNEGINYKKSSFRADKKGRCAFLNEKGLCEIILNLGEKSLCQVCSDHPRFRTFLGDRVEVGLGFCCEEATRIILSFEGKIAPELVSDDNECGQLDFIEQSLLDFRQKALDKIQNDDENINKRMDELLTICNAKIEATDYNKIIKKFLSLERLNKSWTKRLKSVRKNALVKGTAEKLAHYAEQFLINSLYRHLCNAEDTFDARARAISIVVSWWIINSIYKLEEKDEFNALCDIVREYSAEVEYSQNNLDKLFAFFCKFIKR